MASEPKTIRETNLALLGLEGKLGLLQSMVWAVIGLLGTLIAGAFALYSQIGEIKTDVAVVKSSFSALKEQQTAIQESIRSIDAKSQASFSRIENRLGGNQLLPAPQESAPLNLAQAEVDLIKAFLKVSRTTSPLATSLGMNIEDDTSLRPLPQLVVAKIPRLAAYSYMYDPSGALVLVSNRNRKVEAIIQPA
ncbi:hypothetical protein [Bradyrhizobium sp. AUGA SZCCT0182]|uniref:hypothetical protein n=1 Tax=Bradyrhizobium sp. AUGA SZCCT0182 TaxID=2807667 RepID=UPI001BABA8A2|nr:hypothetical protein [Bradyrhizobium sp. AUGA SZCCT0182]MBR1232581.1 hypothetical protein [Bradyrhizobium sp. AUGA SZCCT0182]